MIRRRFLASVMALISAPWLGRVRGATAEPDIRYNPNLSPALAKWWHRSAVEVDAARRDIWFKALARDMSGIK